MVATTFQKLLSDAQRAGVVTTRGKESLQYLSTVAKTLATVSSATIIREADKSELVTMSQIASGKMYFFYYDPKYKEELPYFDRFPCIFPVNHYKGGFLGLNLHYLPYQERAQLMDALYDVENSPKYPRNKKLQISYGILKATTEMDLYKPCIKRYLNNHVRSRFFKIDYEAWNIAAFLPIADFEKASETEVWAESRAKMS